MQLRFFPSREEALAAFREVMDGGNYVAMFGVHRLLGRRDNKELNV